MSNNTIEFKLKISDISGNVVRNIRDGIAAMNSAMLELTGSVGKVDVSFDALGASKDGVDGLGKSCREVDNVVEQLTQRAADAGNSFREAANAAFRWNQIKEVIAGVSDMLQKINAPAQQFNRAMREVNTMAGKGEADFKRLKSAVHELSTEIPMARDLLARGLYQTISNGVPEDNWIEFLDQSAKSAVGGLANLEKVVTVTSTVIKNYGLDWEQAGAIQDKIQTTAKNGVTSFEQLADALPRVSGNAATLGVSIDDLMATFATLTGVSGNTAEVSTQLAAVFTALIKPSSEAGKMAQQMGVDFNAASIKAAGGMIPFLQKLNTSIDEYAARSGMLREEIYGMLFGSAEALRAIVPLTGELGSKFVENSELMVNSTGAINEAFAQMNAESDSISQKLSNWIAGFSDLANSIIGTSMPYVTFIAQTSVAVTQIGAVSSVIKKLVSGLGVSKVALAAKSVAMGIAAAASRAYNYALKGLTISLGSAKVATVALWGAITLGASFLIQGVIEMISRLTGRVEDNTQAMDAARQAEQQYKNALAEARAEMKLVISELAVFNGSKEEEARKVSELNAKYGEAFGYYQTVADWYDTLTAKSELYCKMMVNEAKIKQLINNRIAKESEIETIIKTPDKEYDTDTSPDGIKYPERVRKKEALKHVFQGKYIKERKIEGVKGEVANIDSEIEKLLRDNIKLDKEMLTPKVEGGNILPTEAKAGVKIEPEIEIPAEYQRGLSDIWEEMFGDEIVMPLVNTNTLKHLGDAIEYYRNQVQVTTGEEQIAAQQSVNDYTRRRKAIEDMLAALDIPTESKSLEDFDRIITHLEDKLRKTSGVEQAEIHSQINAYKAKRDAMEYSVELLGMPADVQQLIGAPDDLEVDLNVRLKGLETVKAELVKLQSLMSITQNDDEKQVISGKIEALQNYAGQFEKTGEKGDALKAAFGGVRDIVSSISGLMNDGAGAWLNYVSSVLSTIPALITAITTLTGANVGAAATGAAASVASTPWVGPILAAAAFASTIAALSAIPKFADGGIAYGTTMGIFGEYAGAANNPEVVAPLNKLRSLIQPTAGGDGEVTFRIEGRTLVGVLNKMNKINNRTQ